MLNRKIAIYIAFITIFIIAAQFMLAPSIVSEGIKNPAQNTKAAILAKDFHSTSAILGRDHRKTSEKTSLNKLQSPFKIQFFYQITPASYLIQTGVVFDYRQKISRNISDYFHGSKYKIHSLPI